MEEPKSELYLCACGGEGITLQKWDNDEVYLAIWNQGYRSPLSLKEKIRWMWHILVTGKPWADEIILDNKIASQLGIMLIALANEEVKDV